MGKYDHLNDNIIKSYTVDKLSIREICELYSIKSKHHVCKVVGSNTRSLSESICVAHERYPEKYKHSEEVKEKIRVARCRYLKEHPEDTAWRKSKKNISYPESCFIRYLIDRGLVKIHSIEREKSFYPYYADFAFNDIMVVVEIDGSQHLEEGRRLSDEKKDKLITSLGWKVIRITEDTVKKDWESIDRVLISEEYKASTEPTRVGIFKSTSGYVKVSRNAEGKSVRQIESSFKQRKVKRPDKETLSAIIMNSTFVDIGKTYNVSDKTISNWCRHYGLPYRRRDIIS